MTFQYFSHTSAKESQNELFVERSKVNLGNLVGLDLPLLYNKFQGSLFLGSGE